MREFVCIPIGFSDTPGDFSSDFFLPLFHHSANIFLTAARASHCATDQSPTCTNLAWVEETNSKETGPGRHDSPDAMGLSGEEAPWGWSSGTAAQMSDTLAGS